MSLMWPPLLYFARDKKALDLSMTSEKFSEERLGRNILRNMKV